MPDNRFNQYIIDEEAPKEVVKLEKPILKQELNAPAIPPNQQSILPHGVLPLPLPSQMMTPTLGASIPTTPVAAPIDINALKEQAQQLKKDVGSASAPNLLPKDLSPLTLGAIGTGLLAGTLGVGYLLSKKSSISDRDIRKIEPELNVNRQPQPGVTDPVYHEPQFTDMPTEAEKLSAESMKMQANELPGSIQAKYGTTPTKASEMVMFANQATPEMKAGFAPALIDMMNKGKVVNQPDANLVAKAQESGVTTSTSVPEAQTLVTTKANAQTPTEKVAESINPPVSAELRTGSGMPAIQGTAPPGTPLRKELASAANIPSNYAFVPGGQYMDIVRNAVGQDAFTASLLKQGGYPQTPEEAYSLSRLINENMSRMPRDVAKDLNIGLGDTTKAITQKVAGGKAVKLAGATGALILMADLANAKTPQEKKEAMRNLGEAILPPSMTSTEAGAPTLPPGAYTESRKLGSPFYKMFKEGAAPPSMR